MKALCIKNSKPYEFCKVGETYEVVSHEFRYDENRIVRYYIRLNDIMTGYTWVDSDCLKLLDEIREEKLNQLGI